MSFGIQICDNAGKLIYDTNAVAWMMAFSTYLPAGSGGSYHIPSIIGREAFCTVAFAGMPSPTTGGQAPVVVIDNVSGYATVVVTGNLPAMIMILTR